MLTCPCARVSSQRSQFKQYLTKLSLAPLQETDALQRAWQGDSLVGAERSAEDTEQRGEMDGRARGWAQL